MVHELKTHPEPFCAVWDGRKTYEIRKNDRGFVTGDLLWLNEWDPETQCYSGRAVLFEVLYMTSGGYWGLPAELCVLGGRMLMRRTFDGVEVLA